MILQSITELRAQIASREVELQSVQSYATGQNPSAIRLRSELGAMRAQLSALEGDQKRNAQSGGIASAAGNVPEAGLEYSRKQREVKYHAALLEILAKQAEAARIDQAKAAPVIEVVDRAVTPDKKSGPPRTVIVIGFLFAGLLMGCIAAVLEHLLARLRCQPAHAIRLRELQSQFRFGPRRAV
jgi:uncharacterized protein involved in exopolysaccharide biosynthesis